jgi:flagellar hook assembly protein FlgD
VYVPGIQVYDPANNLIRTLKDAVSEAAGSRSGEWDGKDVAGVVQPDGTLYDISA